MPWDLKHARSTHASDERLWGCQGRGSPGKLAWDMGSEDGVYVRTPTLRPASPVCISPISHVTSGTVMGTLFSGTQSFPIYPWEGEGGSPHSFCLEHEGLIV